MIRGHEYTQKKHKMSPKERRSCGKQLVKGPNASWEFYFKKKQTLKFEDLDQIVFDLSETNVFKSANEFIFTDLNFADDAFT